MTRLGFGAFGANSIQVDGLTIQAGAPTVVTSPFTGGGPYALECVATGAAGVAAQYPQTLTDGRGYFLRARVRISGTPTANTLLLGFTNTSLAITTAFGLVLLSGSRDIRLWAGGVRGVAGPTLAINTDYVLEVYVQYSSAGNDTVTGRVDGTQFETFTGAVTATLGSGPVLGVTTSAGITAHYTDWALNDDQGASDNSWCGDARVVMLLPASDDTGNSNIGADAWRLINSGTTNLYTGVDNTPPVGIASPGSGTSQIVVDTPSAARNYTAVTQPYSTYAAAGDTITHARGVIEHGEAISTGTKTGSVTLFANPSDGSPISLTFGSDAGADGTFPTNWTRTTTALVLAPSVTLSSGASLRVTADISTRSSDVCFMGVYVEYTTGAAGVTATPGVVGLTAAIQAAAPVLEAQPSAAGVAVAVPVALRMVPVSPPAIGTSLAALAPTPIIQAAPSAVALAESVLAPTPSLRALPAGISLNAASSAPAAALQTLPAAVSLALGLTAPTPILQAFPSAAALVLALPPPTITTPGGVVTATPSSVALALSALAPALVLRALPAAPSLVVAAQAASPMLQAQTGAVALAVSALTAAVGLQAAPSSVALALSALAPAPASRAQPSAVALAAVALAATARLQATPSAVALTLALLAAAPALQARPSAVALGLSALASAPAIQARPSLVVLTLALPAPTIIVGSGVTATPSRVALTLALLAPTPILRTFPASVALALSAPAAIRAHRIVPGVVALSLSALSPAPILRATPSAIVAAINALAGMPTVQAQPSIVALLLVAPPPTAAVSGPPVTAIVVLLGGTVLTGALVDQIGATAGGLGDQAGASVGGLVGQGGAAGGGLGARVGVRIG